MHIHRARTTKTRSPQCVGLTDSRGTAVAHRGAISDDLVIRSLEKIARSGSEMSVAHSVADYGVSF